MRAVWWLLTAVVISACGAPVVTNDGGQVEDAGPADAGEVGEPDAGATDAGATDAGATDAGATDAGATDAGSADAGSTDAGSTDAGSTDAGSTDAGPATFCDATTCLSLAGETCWSCWSGKPATGGSVTIASSERILLDESIDVDTLAVVGTLTTAPRPLNLRARGIEVRGTWSAGSSLAPHPAPLRVTLHGTTRLIDVTAGGVLSLHAPVPTPVFTTLAGAVDAGATTVPLTTSTTWSAGDEVLVTPSGHLALSPAGAYLFPDGGRGPTDYATLLAASASALTLSSPLTSPRHGVLDAGAPVDLRAEIADLTRLIVLEGEDDADWDAGLGVRVRAQGPGARLELEGVRIDRAGARGQLRSAALLLHSLAVDAGVVRGSVVTRAPRAVELVLTSGAVLSDNVFARLEGHGVWLTTGLERDNVLEGNLVTDLRAPRAPTAANLTEVQTITLGAPFAGMCGVSAFVISNPDNVLRRNVASDLEGCGYWLSFAESPRDVASAEDLNPSRVAFGTFEDNRAHSIGVGVMLGSAITHGVSGDVAASVRYRPQADESRYGPFDSSSTLRARLTRTSVLGAQLSPVKLEGRVTLAAPVLWSAPFTMLSVDSGSRVEVEDGLLVGQLGPAAQPIDPPSICRASGYDSLTLTRTRLAHFPTHPTQRRGGVLFTYDFPIFGFDLTLERWSQLDLTDVELGALPPTPPDQYDVTGPILDASGIGGFPGRWWVRDVPFFTQGNTCTPARRGAGSEGQLCATSGYFGLGALEAGVGTGTTTPLFPAAELVRFVTGGPNIGFHSPLAVGRSRALPVPVGETVELRLPGYPVPPRRLKFDAWGRPGQRAVVRIAYPAGTTFVITAQNEFYGPLPPGPVTFTPAASLAELSTEPTGTRYFFSGGYLYLPLRSDFRTRTEPFNRDPILITATGASLP